MSRPPGRHGIILFAHGSREPAWHAAVQAIAARVAALAPDALVACAYLELTEPAFATACGDLVAQGAGRIDVVPAFLGMGRHAREDLPRLLDEARARHPGVRFELHAALGEAPEVIDIMARIALAQSGR